MHRKTLVGGLAACACLAAALPAAASADTTVPIQLSFNHLVIDTPVTPNAQVVTPTTQPASVTADVNTTTGQFTVPTDGFSAPAYEFTSPTDGSITLTLAKEASGTVDPNTGALTLTADFLADIVTKSYGSCDQPTGTITLSTSGTKPLPGHVFPTGDEGFISGAGAFGAGWSSIPTPGTGSGCQVIDSFIQGSGGIWFSRDISPIPAKLALTPSKVKSVKAGKKATIKVKVSNSGGNAASKVKVCLEVPKPLKGTKCDTIKSVAAGKSSTVSFKVTTDKKKHGTYKLKLTASSTGLTSVKKTVKLKVTK